MTVRATSPTMGHASPATVADDAGGAGGYLYKKDPRRTPDHPDYVPLTQRQPEAPNPLARADNRQGREKAERFAEFCRLREQEHPLDVPEAGRHVGIKANTALAYERERKQRREEGT